MASLSSSADVRPYTTFAWQGISLTVPASWDLVLTEGSYHSGSVRLADQEGVRLEVRWRSGRDVTPPGASADAHVANLTKSARKGGPDVSVQRNLALAAPPGKEVECYRWAGGHQVLAMASRCAECGRAVHVQLLGRPADRLKGLARTVFGSLRDHPEGGRRLWKFLDVEFATPDALSLRRSALQSGCIRMTFAGRRIRLEFVRVSLAELLLSGQALAEWFRGFYGPSLKRRSYRIRPEEVKGHPGLMVEGRPWVLVSPLRLLGRGRSVRAACWHCAGSNRLFVCCFEGPEAHRDCLAPFVESVRCCRGV